jgi:hypothetical protein
MGSIFEVVVYLVIIEIIGRLSIYIVNLLILLLYLTVRIYVVFHHIVDHFLCNCFNLSSLFSTNINIYIIFTDNVF